MSFICAWDWAAIAGILGAGATLIAAWVAWIISEQWRNQKRSEILATLANKIYKDMENISNLYLRYNKSMVESLLNKEEQPRLFNLYIQLVEANLTLNDNLKLIYLYKKSDIQTNEMYKKYEKFYKKYENEYGYNSVISTINTSRNINQDKILKDAGNTYGEFNEIFDSVQNEIIKYIFHEK